MKTINKSDNSKHLDTSAVLDAVKDLKVSIDKRFDEMQLENQSVVEQLKEQISQVRKEFNNRMENLAKKVETKVTQNVKKNIDEKVKGLKKDMESDVSKLNRQIKETEKDITRVKETLMPTIQERLGDELDELRNKVDHLQKDIQHLDRVRVSDKYDNKESGSEENRYRNIIVRNLPEREGENVKHRVNNIIQDSLKLLKIYL